MHEDSVWDDYMTARNAGLNPPHIPLEESTTREGYTAMYQWLTEHNMHGAYKRWLAEHGQTVWCPDWCQDDHGPVQVLAPGDDGAQHQAREHHVGGLRGVFCRWESFDLSEREDVVLIQHDSALGADGFEGYLQIPVTAIPDLIELLRAVPLPDDAAPVGR